MISHKRILKSMARNHRIDPDDLLIALWYSPSKRFDYLKNENSPIKNKDYAFAKSVVVSLTKSGKFDREYKTAVPKVAIVYRDHDFSQIGRKFSFEFYLTKEEVLKIYDELVTDFQSFEDPIEPSGLKDESLLESAIFHHKTSFEGKLKYPTIESSAAALMYAISHNHVFYNGNKRAAMVSMLVFLDRHNLSLTCNEDDLFKITLQLAGHKLADETSLYPDAEIENLARWIQRNAKLVKKGERPITIKKLKHTLSHFGCEILDSGKVIRTVKRSGFLNKSRDVAISSKRTINPKLADGREIDMGFVKSLREDLELDSDHGVDSDYFYEMEPVTPSEFIHKYQNLLKRLAKR